VTYSGGDGLTGRVGGTTPGCDSQAMSEGRHGADSSLTWTPACVRTLNAPVEEWVWERQARESLERGGTSPEGASGPRARQNLTRGGGEPVRASSEAEPHRGGVRPSSETEPHPRGRPALERGGTSPEGASGPRARWNLNRGGVQPSSEAESWWYDGVSLERSGISPEGCRG
jgi:hypothetical protein